MRKLFLLSLALMASFSLWADDIYYYGCMNLTNGALTPGTTNTTQFVKGGTPLTTTTDISFSATPSTGGCYYNSSSLSSADLGTSTNWGTSSSSSRCIRGLKFASGTDYTLSLGSKVATSITFYGWCGSKSKTLTIGGVSYGTPSTKNEFFSNEFTKSGNFTGDVTMSQDGDCYGILVITISTTPAETYDVTIDPNGGLYASTPEGWTLSEGVYTKSVAAGSFNVPDGLAYSGYDLTGWKDGQGNSITLPITLSHDTTLVAQWTEHAVSSDATLSALSLAGYTFKETFDPATTAYTVTLPFYASAPATSAVTATANDANASVGTVTYDSENTKYSVTVTAEDKTTTKTYTITLNWAAIPTASSSVNIEQLVLDNGKSYDIGSALDAAHIAYVDKDALDSLLMGTNDKPKDDCNEAYLGLKFKKATSKVTIIVPSGQSLNVKFGAITDGSNLTVSVNGATPSAPSLTNNVYTLSASEGAKEVVFALGADSKTVVFKQIMVNEDIVVVRPFKITKNPTENGTFSVDFEKYAKSEEVTVNCVPETGYQLSTITVIGYTSKGAEQEVEVTGNKFTMPGSPVNITVTFSVATALDNTDVKAKAVKTLKNGLLIIEKNGVRYNMLGERVQ